MVEKRVSVRLVAVGGKEVKAELEGIGDAGAKGAGRFSAAMDQANARLAGFASKARLAAAAAASAAVLAGAAMIRSGLQTIDAQAKLAQSLDTTVGSMQVLERAGQLAGVAMTGIEQATKDMTRRLSQAADGTGPAIKALDRLGLSAADLLDMPLDARIATISDAMDKFVPKAQQAAVAGQIFGEEGSIAMSRIDTATIRQATADLEAFGVIVSDQDAAQIAKTNDALSRLGLITTGLANQLAVAAAPALEAVADALAAVFSVTGPVGQALQFVGRHIGEIVAIAGTFAALMAGQWVVGLIAAAASVSGLATALVVLRAAIARTGIGLLIVGAGELVYQFARLVDGAGGFGNALGLLKDLALEVWDRIRRGASLLGESMEGVAMGIKAAFAGAFATIVEKFASMTGALAEGWNKLLGSFGIESNAQGLGEEWAKGLRKDADYMAESARVFNESINVSWKDLASPLKSWEALKAAVTETGTAGVEAGEDTTEAMKETADAVDDVGKAAGGAAGKVKEMKTELSGFDAAIQSLEDYARDAMDWGKGLGDTLVGAFRGAESAFRDFTRTGKFDFKGMIASILSDLATLAFRSAVLGPLANALAGSFGGGVDLFAGLFHKGGMVGYGAGAPVAVPAAAFAGAPRLHRGGWPGFAPDEVPAVLQRGEKVLSRDDVARGDGRAAAPQVSISIDARGAQAGVAEQIDAKVRAMLPEIKRLAVQSVAEARVRGTI